MISCSKKTALAAVFFNIVVWAGNGIEILKQKYQWPTELPKVPYCMHGWFYNQAQLKRLLDDEKRLIVELGSWLGLSTTFMLHNAPHTLVIAVDHWQGDADILCNPVYLDKIPTLYETFLVNCWKYQDRLIPMKTTTLAGLQEIFDCGLVPDLVYIDASHDYVSVTNDLEKTYELFPTTIITGDDWESPTVAKAARDFANRNNLIVHGEGNFYIIIS